VPGGGRAVEEVTSHLGGGRVAPTKPGRRAVEEEARLPSQISRARQDGRSRTRQRRSSREHRRWSSRVRQRGSSRWLLPLPRRAGRECEAAIHAPLPHLAPQQLLTIIEERAKGEAEEGPDLRVSAVDLEEAGR
jgi:hypothetical protein